MRGGTWATDNLDATWWCYRDRVADRAVVIALAVFAVGAAVVIWLMTPKLPKKPKR
jgi:hypothetical protein